MENTVQKQTIEMGGQSWNDAARANGQQQIHGAGAMTESQIVQELLDGGRLVAFMWTISLLLVTLRRSSGVVLVKSGKSAVIAGLGCSFLTFFVGWWGLPWGPIYTIQSIYKNFSGGTNLTPHVLVNVGGVVRLSLFTP